MTELPAVVLLLVLVIPARAGALQVPHGVTVDIICTGSYADPPDWYLNGELVFYGGGIPRMEEKKELSEQNEPASRLCIDVDMALHQGISLQCRARDKTYNLSLDIIAQLFPPEDVIVNHTSLFEVLIQWSPLSFNFTEDFITIEIEFGVTYYTVYISSTSATHVTNITSNSTKLLFSGMPGEDFNKCREYMLEVTASNAVAGEGKESKPAYVILPKGILLGTISSLIAVLFLIALILILTLIWKRVKQHKSQQSSEIVLQENQVYNVVKQQRSERAMQLEPCGAYGVAQGDVNEDPEYETVS